MQKLKTFIQATLARLGIHQRLKASKFYELYWSIVDKKVLETKILDTHFYRELLEGFRKGDLIFDIGANDGSKTDVFLGLGAQVVAVEPDERNQEILQEKFLKYRLFPKPVVIVGKAVSDRTATQTMWVDGPGSALNTLSPRWVETLKRDKTRFEQTNARLEFAERRLVETTTLEQLIGVHGYPFFVKIDVEGHEASVLRGLKQPVPYLSFEVNLPEFKPEALECVKTLGQIASGKFNYASDFRDGLLLDQWLDSRQFAQAISNCDASSIEVFWKSSAPSARQQI